MNNASDIDDRLAKPAQISDDELEGELAQMRGYRATYIAVVDKARAQGGVDVETVMRALDRFDALERELVDAEDDDARKNIIERAEEVEQSRAYIQPESELVVEANTLVADMKDWGVPKPVLDAIEKDLLTVIREKGDNTTRNDKLKDRRAALNKLYAYYDAWSDHVENYERWATRTAWALGVLLVGASLGCIWAICKHEPLYGFMVAGLAGALLSVLGKFPPMLGWGQWASYTPRMLGRITTGIVTTLAGGALLALDAIRIGNLEFPELFKTKPDEKGMLLLVGLGIVFGFSERALVQFQDLVFNGASDKHGKDSKDTKDRKHE